MAANPSNYALLSRFRQSEPSEQECVATRNLLRHPKSGIGFLQKFTIGGTLAQEPRTRGERAHSPEASIEAYPPEERLSCRAAARR